MYDARMHRIIGQDRAIDRLQKALASERIHHAWIFAGPRGVGKFTAAIEFARILLDPNTATTLDGRIEADPDGRVSQMIDDQAHPDLHIIRKELARYSADDRARRSKLSNIPIGVLRQYMIGGPVGATNKYHDPIVSHTPVMKHGKVFIIDEAEMLDGVSQNALLKTLEEPPQNTYIVLVTSRPDRLLPTVHSRCQLVRFGRLDEDSMRQWLSQARLEVSKDDAQWITDFADGAPGIATLAAEYGFASWQATLAPMLRSLEAGHFPHAMASTLVDLIEQYARQWVSSDQNRSKDAANKDGFSHALSLLSAHARRQLQQCAERGDDPSLWLAAIRHMREAERQVHSNVNYKLVLENLIAQWSHANPRAAMLV